QTTRYQSGARFPEMGASSTARGCPQSHDRILPDSDLGTCSAVTLLLGGRISDHLRCSRSGKNLQCISANTAPVFFWPRPRIWPQLHRFVTKAMLDRLLAGC